MFQIAVKAQSDDDILPDEDDYMDWQEDNNELVQELLMPEDEDPTNYRRSDKYPRRYFGLEHYSYGLDADEKMAQLWEMLVPDETVEEEPTPFMWDQYDGFFKFATKGAFCNKSDELRKNRNKTTHTQGIIAKVEWRPYENEEGITFSGIYEHGSQHAIIRLSSTNNLAEDSKGILPSMAIKFLLSNRLSTNLFAMPNFTGKDENGEESFNFFHRPLKSRVERFESACERDSVEKKLIEGSPVPYATSVVFPAFYDTTDYLNPQVTHHREMGPEFRVPYQLEYEGPSDKFANDRDETWYNRIKQYFNPFVEAEEEEPFIEVYAWTAPP